MATKKKKLTSATGVKTPVYPTGLSFDALKTAQSGYGTDRELLAQKAQPVLKTGALDVVRYRDNPNGTTTNYLSNGATSTVRYTVNPDGTRTPVEIPTAANGFGSGVSNPYVSEYDQLQVDRYKQSQKPIDRNAIRKQKIAEFQAQIDATNQIFSNLTAQAGIQGEDRLGQQRALAARSGNLQQPRGEAQKEQVISYNNQITGDIAARQQSAVSAIMIEAQNRADAEFAQKQQAKELGAQNYLQYLATAEERKQTNAQAVLQSLLAQGLTLEDIPQEQFGQIANSLRMSPDELQNVYRGELAKAAAEQEAAEYERLVKEREFELEQDKFGFEQDKFGAEYNLNVDKFGFEKDKFGAEFDFNREKFGAEFGLKQQEFGFNQKKFQAELGLKYDELNRLINNDQLDFELKNAEIQKKLAEIQEINAKSGAGGTSPVQNDKNLQNVNDALEAVNGLVTDPGLSRAIGKSSIFNFIPGSKGADFAAKLDRVKSLITLPQLEKLKGLGAMSDREFKTLTDAAAALNPKMSETAFKAELTRIQQALESTRTKLETNSLFNQFEGGSGSTNPKGLGSLSEKYESGGRPEAIGYDNTGGWSYGTYQLAHDNVNRFLQSNPVFGKAFAGLQKGTQAFNNKWKEVAAKAPQQFAEAQKNFIAQTHFTPQVNKLQKLGFNINKYSNVLKDVIWSTAVQHGANTDVIASAIKKVGNNATEEQLIKAIYNERWSGGARFARSTPNVKQSVYNRFFGKNGELNLALSRIKNNIG